VVVTVIIPALNTQCFKKVVHVVSSQVVKRFNHGFFV